ncbi:MAG: hypothetical protein KTR31_37775 [Myxococcales bacterium]|nr:hypothetical protein [Myxococcales bacterium]
MTTEQLEQLAARTERSACFVPQLPPLHRLPPEGQLFLARILAAQHLRGDAVELPPWRTHRRLPLQVQLAFQRLEIAMAPSQLAQEALTERGLNALLGMSAHDVRTEDFTALFDAICALDHPESRAPWRNALHAHLITLLDQQSERSDPRSLVELYQRLLTTSAALNAVERVQALGGVVPPFTTQAPLPQALAAIRAHGARGDRVVLRHVAADPEARPAVRGAAVQALGGHATRSDLDDVLRWCVAAPEQLAPSAVAFLVALRHRGIFVQAEHLDALFTTALHAPCPLDALTAHLHAERLAWLLQVDPDDRRQLPWLLALDVPDSELTPWLIRLLDSGVYSIRAAALQRLARPEHTSAEPAVLAQLHAHPDEVRHALAVIGGDATRQLLLDAFLGGEPALDERWLPVLLGLLADDDSRLDTVLERIPPGSELLHRLGSLPRGAAVRQIVRLSRGMNAVALFTQLCALRSALVLPELVYLLQQHTAALCDQDDGVGLHRRTTRPSLLPAVRAAMGALGTALASRGSLPPLVGHVDHQQAPEALTRWLVVTALDDASDAARRAMLVRSLPLEGLAASRLVAWGRTEDRELRRDVLGRMAEHTDVVTVGPYVLKAMASPDVMVARAAARAAVQLRLAAAVPALVAMLDHPKMDHKRIAARGLAQLGDWRAIDRLLHWLGTHDNHGFRAELLAALRAVQPHGAAGLIRAALQEATGRRATLLGWAAGAVSHTRPVPTDEVPDHAPPVLSLVVRAHRFDQEPTPEHLDAVLVEPLTELSLEAHRALAWIAPRLLQGLATDPPTDREAREIRGRSARHLLQWLSHQPTSPSERHEQIAQLRALPTLPMGDARWTALRALDALPTAQDLGRALQDCTHSAHRDRDMHTILRSCGVNSDQRHLLVAASDDDRSDLLDALFAQRPVGAEPWASLDDAPSVDRRPRPPAPPAAAVADALEHDTPIPDSWPWASARWDDVVRLPGRRLPRTHAPLLRGLFVDALDALESTPDRVRWVSGWAQPPQEISVWLNVPPPPWPALSAAPPQVPVGTVAEALPPLPPERPEGTALTQEDWLAALADPERTRVALRALAGRRDEAVVAAVRPLLQQRAWRAAALRCFRTIAPREEVHAVLREMLADRDDEWVRSCARVLGHRRDPGSIRTFVQLLSHRSPGVQRAAREALTLQPAGALAELYPIASRARPDQRGLYDALIAKLEALV